MELIGNGHFKQVFEIWGGSIYSSQTKEHIKDKKFNAYYYIRSRYKNNSRYSSDCNTESMTLEFDSNLSTDFNYSEVDLINETAIEFKLIESSQPSFGKTKLTIESQYTNEKQELFVNIDYVYCETVGGTITKRLAEYKKAFDKFSSEQRLKKFKLHKRHIIEQLGMHIYNNYINKNFTMFQVQRCNEVLVIFSILNDNCLEIPERFYIQSTPWNVLDGNFNKFRECSIQVEYAEKIKRIVDSYLKNWGEVTRIVADSTRRVNSFSDASYSDIKPKILELFNSEIQ